MTNIIVLDFSNISKTPEKIYTPNKMQNRIEEKKPNTTSITEILSSRKAIERAQKRGW